MATQMKSGLPSGEFSTIDNGSAPSFPTLDITSEHIGYDNKNVGSTAQYSQPTPGTESQGANPLTGDIGGAVLLDLFNDIAAYPDPSNATVKGNPTQGTQFGYTALTKVYNDQTHGNLLFKNPA